MIGNHFEVISNGPTHNYSLRNRERPVPLIAPRIVSGQNSIQYRGDKIWEEIPQSIQNCHSLKNVKRAMKLKLLESGN